MYSRPPGLNIIYLSLKWEHLCSNFRPTATKGSIGALVKRNRKGTVGVDLRMLWTSDSVQEVKDTWAKPSLLMPITHYDTLNIFQNNSFNTTASPMCSPAGTALCCLWSPPRILRCLGSCSVGDQPAHCSEEHKHRAVKVLCVRAAHGRLHPLTSPLLLWNRV